MVATYGLGPVTHGLGLFQPVLSYNNTITISAVADRDMMPDPAFYAECLQRSFDELKRETIGKKAKKKAAKKKTARSPRKKPASRAAGNGDARSGAEP